MRAGAAKPRLPLLGLLMLFSLEAFAAPRRVTSLDDGWRFERSDVAGAEGAGFDDSKWARVRVPHTWNAVDGQDGGNDYHRGVGWYRRKQTVPASESGRRLYVEFDGANLETTLFVNGREVGRHAGGYARFRFDVTSAVKVGASNVFAVKVSNAANKDVAPRSADYTFFGGIYRDVRLVSVGRVHLDLDSFGSSGVFATPKSVTREAAAVDVRASVTNAASEAREVDVSATIRDGAKVVARATAHATLAPNATHDETLPLTVASPHLWDGVRDPFSYALDVEVAVGGHVVDAVSEPLGLRFFDFDASAGFSLNGRALPLHGVNRHQDREDKGWAVTPRDEDEDVALIRELGANAVRLAHYQQSQHIYDLCDKYGLVVWAEIPVVNSAGTGAFVANAEQQLTELIRQSAHHPSIVTWSVANELQHDKSDPGAVEPLVAALNARAHEEDPSRPTALATFYAPTDPSAAITDLVGFNRYDGWYVKTIDDFASGLDVMRARRPQLRMAVSEYGAGASVAIHSATPKKMDHSEEYQALFIETYAQALAARPWVWGSFVWNMFDFASDGRKEGDHAGCNDKGLVTYDRKTKKDAFYFLQASWSPRPMVHVAGRRFSPRPAGPVDVKVYSNAETVSLRVGATALPPQSAPNHIFVWRGVSLSHGSNIVEATAVVGGRTVRDRVTIVGR
ncbi:MAG TPA: glycoside hydrolase family 2 TIM barrel-domain containing protein [Polyangia bacterium]|nr:glycoside hydrolase family 2 TIM barrel-domain containing protein [Polyangia bacterium]